MPLDTDVPADADPHRCPYCDRPFRTPARVDLHVGLTHYDTCSDAEADAFETAYDAERESLRVFQLKAAGVLVLLYFGMLILYAIVT